MPSRLVHSAKFLPAAAHTGVPRGLRAHVNQLRRIVLSACAAAAVLTTSACSGVAVQVSYRNADLVAMSRVDKYLALDDAQDAVARRQMQQFFAWHRYEELPEYARWLRSLKPQFARPMSPDEFQGLIGELERRADRSAARFAQDMAPVVSSLQPRQLAHMRKVMDERTRELMKEYIEPSPAKLRDERFDDLLLVAERIWGSLSSEQKRMLRAASDARPLDHALFVAERRRVQDDSVATFAKVQKLALPAPRAATELLALYDRSRPSPDPQRRAYFEQVTRGSAAALAQLSQTVTPAQRKHAQEFLESLASDFDELSRRKVVARAE